MIGDLKYIFLCPITNTRDKCHTKYDNYMVIWGLNAVVLCLITNNRDKCLTKYDNYMVIGDLNYDLVSNHQYS